MGNVRHLAADQCHDGHDAMIDNEDGAGTQTDCRVEVLAPVVLNDTGTVCAHSGEFLDEAFGRSIIRNVTTPTITPVLPKDKKRSQAAIIVAPGGGFQFLFAESEGFAVAQRIARRGIAAFVLKYRVEPTPPDPEEANAIMSRRLAYLADPADRFTKVTQAEQLAIADGAAAVRTVRKRASQWGIDRSAIAFLGFAAGGLVAGGLASSNSDSRPDTLGIIYSFFRDKVPPMAPPVFIAAAADDSLLEDKPIRHYQAWLAANRPAELHLFEKGGHDFASDPSGFSSERWLDSFLCWNEMQRSIKAGR